jgi:predicted ATPase
MYLDFQPPIQDFIQATGNRPLTVLCGPNNSGKSLALKSLKQQIGQGSYMMGAQRFSHVYHLSTQLRNENELYELETQFQTNFAQEQFNYEQNFLDLQRVLLNLDNSGRDKLFAICSELLDAPLVMKRVDPDNDLSPWFIEMGGHNLSVGSTGARLLITMLGIFMDARFSVMLVDEPELGLAPRVQAAVARLLSDDTRRRQYFPHLRSIYLSTHSHLFLSKASISDNWRVANDGNTVTLERLASVGDLHRLQFNLLGNSFEDLFLPAAIVVVEGKTDHEYLERVIRLRFPERRITVVPGQGDPKRVVHSLSTTLGSLQSSPFADRIFVVLDAVHQPGLVADLVAMGVTRQNVVEWQKNGIEYLYPGQMMAREFNCAPSEVADLQITDDVVALNTTQRRKTELAKRIVGGLDSSTPLPDELANKLLAPLERAMN